ncbi:hypothetical protein RFI_13763 [Reticulomyxa filosa]|uniref:Uncharacterized protein n=1 Tax=Reticulomyxa filosa TaxID=46433 RepID=X6NAW9_RETFI|nr:hypothetical protein RFI_13763 [Reticulomyxa filosa]|eukprot:ETO23420.1 hypothetical protein RFI_13763 [Reticulomyxa filosa]
MLHIVVYAYCLTVLWAHASMSKKKNNNFRNTNNDNANISLFEIFGETKIVPFVSQLLYIYVYVHLKKRVGKKVEWDGKEEKSKKEMKLKKYKTNNEPQKKKK